MTQTTQTLTPPSQPAKAAEGKQSSFHRAIESLAETPYACASLEPLSGGLLNATYKGILARPLEDGTETVFIKYSAEHAHKLELTFPLNRCIAEHMTLQALERASMQLLQHNQVSIRIPRLYQYLPQHHTQILEDLSPTHTLHQFLSSHPAGSEDPSAAARIGEALGTWLLRFHTWSRTQVPPYLSEVIRTNTNALDQCITKYKLLSLGRQCADPKVRQYAAEVYQSRLNDIVVHGDFSSRNILIQNLPSPVDGTDTTSLAVVDWEVCSYADYTRDVANLMSDLYMKYYFSGSKPALSMLEGFIGAYPLRDEASVYRTVSKIGENFFHWHTYSPGTHTDEQVEEIRQLAADFIKPPEQATEITPVSPPPTQIDAVKHSEKDSRGEGGHDENVVDWDGPDDPEMPTNWPKHRKFAIIGVVTASRFLTTLATSMMSPALLNIRADFAGTSETIITFTVSIYMIGYGIGPLVLAPMSEVYGRSPIYHTGSVLYTIFSVGCALAPNVAGLLVFRFLAGLAGGVPVTNAGGTIADVIPHHRRGLIQSIFGASVLVAPSLAPVAGGFLVEAAGWRWIFWLMTILSGLVTIASFVLLRETYGPVLLQRRAARLHREQGNDLLYARGSTGLTLRQKTIHAIRRPIALLCRSPIIILGSLYLALVYGIAYLLLTSIPLVFHDVYGWSQWAAGLAPLGTSVGYFVGVFVTGRYSDRIYVRQQESLGGEAVPECRLFFLFPAAVALPTGLIVYGWTAQFHIQWVLPLVGTGIFSLGLIFVFNGIQSYIIDSFSSYAASATAAISLVRCIAGGLLPLSGPEMYRHLGYGRGNTLLGIVSAVFGVVSLGLWRYGERLRERDPVRLD